MTPKPTIHLRPVEQPDLPTLFDIQSDPIANKLSAVIARTEDAFYTLWDKIFTDPKVTARAILADNHLVGSISCFQMEDEDHVGYAVAREHWNRGIATRALALLLEEVPTRPLHARAAKHNPASIRVLERNGFEITGYRLSPAHERFLECEEALLVLR